MQWRGYDRFSAEKRSASSLFEEAIEEIEGEEAEVGSGVELLSGELSFNLELERAQYYEKENVRGNNIAIHGGRWGLYNFCR